MDRNRISHMWDLKMQGTTKGQRRHHHTEQIPQLSLGVAEGDVRFWGKEGRREVVILGGMDVGMM